MDTFVLAVVQILRFIGLPVAVWQIVTLYPSLAFPQFEHFTAGMWMLFGMKVTAMVIGFALFFGLAGVAKRRRSKITEKPPESHDV